MAVKRKADVYMGRICCKPINFKSLDNATRAEQSITILPMLTEAQEAK